MRFSFVLSLKTSNVDLQQFVTSTFENQENITLCTQNKIPKELDRCSWNSYGTLRVNYQAQLRSIRTILENPMYLNVELADVEKIIMQALCQVGPFLVIICCRKQRKQLNTALFFKSHFFMWFEIMLLFQPRYVLILVFSYQFLLVRNKDVKMGMAVNFFFNFWLFNLCGFKSN